ncbi:hypothetical protein NM688_g7210 [Phlebia brevispora]|uniref:Uncharacterized protein n=1 Tax=Phlebia brevispora TaxID=194682 RepID=A0ACC1S7U3_9APHY|nr:hypothetical protein NM688_g7210 [Phlebia brevispora]
MLSLIQRPGRVPSERRVRQASIRFADSSPRSLPFQGNHDPEVPPLPEPYEPRDDPAPPEPSHTANASRMQPRVEEIPNEDEYDEQAEGVRPGPSADVMADEEWETDIPAAQLEDLRIAQEFIRLVQDATLAADKLDPQVLYRLRNPSTEELDLSCPILRMSLEVYHLDNITIDTYNGVRRTVQRNLNVMMLSYDQVKRRCAEISGVCPVYHDMCVDTCAGFTGPFAALDKCPICNKDRFELRYPRASARRRKKFPRRQFLTIPCGPQLQALSRTPEGAAAMSYRERCTTRLMAELPNLDWKVPVLKDYLFGQEYVEAVRRGEITNNDIVLLISMDGAQLYAHKLSDCWIYIWVVLEHSPEVRYKKKHILPGGIIPGPNKPKNVDSFLFPGMHHTAALMKEGFSVWNALTKEVVPKHPYLACGAADGPGMCYFNGCVGHKGANGCRLYCGQQGRLKPNSTHYYPACLKPLNYEVPSSSHPDIDLRVPPASDAPSLTQRYYSNLRKLMLVSTIAKYKEVRRETGLFKPSIFLGFPSTQISSLPGCFPADIMHLVSLNLPDLLLKLWRGTFECDKNDDKSTWDWVCLTGTAWKAHGQAIADTCSYFPGSFDRPPCNIAEKMNSGYKAIEYLHYLYGLGPAMLRELLPPRYWQHYCKLVHGIRIVHQRTITLQELEEAHWLLVEFCEEYELLYYRRLPYRLHFVCYSMHALIHTATESYRIGPHIYFSQWTLERLIGQLVGELRQPSNPYRNLSERALRRAQASAIKAMVSDLEQAQRLPRGTIDLGGGFSLRRACESRLYRFTTSEVQALHEFELTNPICDLDPAWHESPAVLRWARVGLPTAQIACSMWGEEKCQNPRISRNVKYMHRDHGGRLVSAFGEVQYYFQVTTIRGNEGAYAMMKIYSEPDTNLYNESSGALWVCCRQEAYEVVPVKRILSVVAAIPMPDSNHRLGSYEGQVFIVEKMGLDVMPLLEGGAEPDEEDQ